jgi:hypothetical protein
MSADFDASYDVCLTGRDIYWIIKAVDKELTRLKKLPAEDLRQKPTQEAFEKLSQIGQG